jgi:hypothetical protein
VRLIWGIVLIVLTLVICWLGQVVSAISPELAARLGLSEAEDGVDPAYYADGRGEAIWDALSLWVLPVAGILLLLDAPSWALFGLPGGAIYVYFSGRGLLVRRELRRSAIRIEPPETARLYSVMLAIWGVAGAVTAIMAAAELAK